jgi:uncharacterized protein (TIGR02466 family)
MGGKLSFVMPSTLVTLLFASVVVASAAEKAETKAWPTPIWVKDDALSAKHVKKIKSLMVKEKKRDRKGVIKSNMGGYQSDVDWIHREARHKAIKKLHDVLLKNAAEFVFQWQNSGVSRTKDGSLDFPMFEVWINGGWVNSNSYLNFNMPHVHPESYISGTLYFPPTVGGNGDNMGNLTFEDPRDFSASEHLSFQPRPGRLLLWPAWLGHSVQPNPTKGKKRYSISFNIQVAFINRENDVAYPGESLLCNRNQLRMECESKFGRMQRGAKASNHDAPSLFLHWPTVYKHFKFTSQGEGDQVYQDIMGKHAEKYATPIPTRLSPSVLESSPMISSLESIVGHKFVAVDSYNFKAKSPQMIAFANDRQARSWKTIVILKGRTKVKFVDPRKMCSFGFRYTFGCPEGLGKNIAWDMNEGDVIVFPSSLHHIIPPNVGESDLQFIVGTLASSISPDDQCLLDSK